MINFNIARYKNGDNDYFFRNIVAKKNKGEEKIWRKKYYQY